MDKGLNRFITAQDKVYQQVLIELTAGKKQSHWMWFIFPQMLGLGQSQLAILYGIQHEEEAIAYLEHPLLGARLLECTRMLLALQPKSAIDILGHPDDLKLKSSMTLFAQISPENSLFQQLLTACFKGKQDMRTIKLLNEL